MARALRVITTAEKPKTQMRRPVKPQFPYVMVGETVAKHPAIKNVGSKKRMEARAGGGKFPAREAEMDGVVEKSPS